MRYTRLFTADDGCAHFEDAEVAAATEQDTLGFTKLFPASAVCFAEAAPGHQIAQAPESRRSWVLCLTGSVQISATGGSRTFLPGDLLLVEDVVGSGHSSFTPDGYTAAVIVL